MDLKDEVREDLRKRTQEAIETDLMETETPEMNHKANAAEEKIERQAFSKTGASMTPEQVEYLVRNKTDMDNEELEKFIAGEHEASSALEGWNSFSRTDEKYMIQNYQMSGPEEMAERLDRTVEEVRLKLKLMGLKPEQM